MKRSTERILTTHVGSLPIPEGLDESTPGYDNRLCNEVSGIVQRGELSKVHWLASQFSRLPQSGERLLQKFRGCLANSGFASIGRAVAWQILNLLQAGTPLPQHGWRCFIP